MSEFQPYVDRANAALEAMPPLPCPTCNGRGRLRWEGDVFFADVGPCPDCTDGRNGR